MRIKHIIILFISFLIPSAALMAAGGGEFNLSEVIAHHLGDAPIWHFELGGIDMSITKRVVMMWIGSAILFLIFIPAAVRIKKINFGKPSRFTGVVEVFVNFVRKDVSESSMGALSKPYDPFLLTLFFFILVSNLLGLVPPLGEIANIISENIGSAHPVAGHGEEHSIPFLVSLWPGSTATGDVSVTASLAVMSFLVIQLAGFIHQGFAYIKNIVPGGIHWALWPIMWPIELIGQFTKPFALAIRLLANMTAGHLIILVLMGFIFQFKSYGIVPISIAGATAIYMLELFVAFLQAYIFTFLTALFISAAQHRH